MKARIQKTSDEDKARYVALYHTGRYSLREIAAMGGFSRQTIFRWVKNGTTYGGCSRYVSMKRKTSPQSADPRDAEIALLRAALEKAELRAHALDTMIDVAEANLNIKILKKAGAKQ